MNDSRKNIVHLLEKDSCCGCASCLQACPKNCIRMVEDEKGFLYPFIDNATCIECGICEKVCPALHPCKTQMPINVWAAQNRNEVVRKSSSSGGVFFALAEWTLKKGGAVFGVRFDENWEAYHDCAETLEDVKSFMGSKYVQSRIERSYQRAKDLLVGGRIVLYTGTGCQIAGLKHYLKKEYENLITIEVICHGVPSPLVWRNYLLYRRQLECETKHAGIPIVADLSFKDKSKSWKYPGLIFRFINTSTNGDNEKEYTCYENLYKNLYIRGYLSNLYLRPSCYTCSAKSGRSQSDLTIGDYWGMPKELQSWDDDKGTSLILAYSEKGIRILKELDIELRETTFEKGIKQNRTVVTSYRKPKETDKFWMIYPSEKEKAIEECLKDMQPSCFYRMARSFYIVGRRIIGKE